MSKKRDKFQDREYRAAYAESFLDTSIATQIRVIREQRKLKQKELAKMLHTTDTQLSEIIHKKRKPSVTFLKALNQILGIDGNLLLRLA